MLVQRGRPCGATSGAPRAGLLMTGIGHPGVNFKRPPLRVALSHSFCAGAVVLTGLLVGAQSSDWYPG